MRAEEFADAIRAACLKAALNAYEDAGVQGLCEAGRWEAAVGAIASLDVAALTKALPQQSSTAA